MSLSNAEHLCDWRTAGMNSRKLTCRRRRECARELLGWRRPDLTAHDEVVRAKGVVVLCHGPHPLHRKQSILTSSSRRAYSA